MYTFNCCCERLCKEKLSFCLAGRCEPNLSDLSLAFRDCGVSQTELADYLRNVDPIPFAHSVPQFPVPQPSKLQFPKLNGKELQMRGDDIPSHLPPINPELDGKFFQLKGNNSFQ